MNKTDKIVVEDYMEGERLDAALAGYYENMSRSLIKNYINDGQILVNGQPSKASHKLRTGEEITLTVPSARNPRILPQNLPLEIIYQDHDIALINKPQGLVVHPAHGHWENTLVNSLLYHLDDLSGINGILRPGIVHRLDKDTSGIMAIAKNDRAHRSLASQIKAHTINREYTALVRGTIAENQGLIDAPVGRSKTDRKKMAVVRDGKPAQSQYRVVARFKDFTLVKVKLLTGRTHQIRVHFSYIKHSVAGDPVYGSGQNPFNRTAQILHAHLLGFNHPGNQEYMEFTSPLPEYFQNIIKTLQETSASDSMNFRGT
ncbi:MAG: RluA family pseudouridine synthase [Syntrophomonadaceae bacterium]|jgi:23S rRNA pseudouridine1911/1915/1917 synthase|nr:RluA family pseudouridine synthase [Syntrophomonadaceae bacterium]